MNSRTVCILTSGQGTRMGPYANYVNKALLPLKGKAILSHIIGKFPTDTRFVIALGFLGDQVRNYVQTAHPKLNTQFVTVDKFSGPGSGPGYSLLCCREALQQPFYFVSCDTLWDNELDFSLESDWLGVAKVDPDESASYCNLKIQNGKVQGILDKTKASGADYQAFVGLCHIQSYQEFWSALADGFLIKGEHQVSSGIQALVRKGEAGAQEVAWQDVGTFEKYRALVTKHETYDFSKTSEFFYQLDGKVIKFFENAAITEKRVKRASLNPGVFPRISDHHGQFFGYSYVPGLTLYENNRPEIFRRFLAWAQENLWLVPQQSSKEQMAVLCKAFYREKTEQRLLEYYKKFQLTDGPSVVNGTSLPSTKELLDSISWERLYDGIPSFFHGDLQFDNILHDAETGKFMLLDWRQDFGGCVEFGDRYYDLAKLYGGIILNYDYIKKNLLKYEERDGEVFFDFAQRFRTAEYIEVHENFIRSHGYDLGKVRILVGLIYLNMAPLHHYPFDKMLYSLGRWFLNRELNSK